MDPFSPVMSLFVTVTYGTQIMAKQCSKGAVTLGTRLLAKNHTAIFYTLCQSPWTSHGNKVPL